ncbi:MAG: hypothetical protein ABI167_10405 [Nitrosospira sp.]
MKVATPPPDNEELVSRPTLLRLRQVWVYALEKPVVFTVMVSIIGLIYNVAYFGRFGISILEFYEMQDFLLGGLRNPTILLMTFLFILSAFVMRIVQLDADRVNRKSRRDFAAVLAKVAAERPTLAWKLRPSLLFFKFREYVHAKTRLFFICVYTIGAAVVSVSLIDFIAITDANSLSDRSRYCTYLAEGLLSDTPLALIGTSQGFYFLQGIETLEVEVIPRKEVSRMTKMGAASTFCTDHKGASMTVGEQALRHLQIM